jgi:hypothetical protein
MDTCHMNIMSACTCSLFKCVYTSHASPHAPVNRFPSPANMWTCSMRDPQWLHTLVEPLRLHSQPQQYGSARRRNVHGNSDEMCMSRCIAPKSTSIQVARKKRKPAVLALIPGPRRPALAAICLCCGDKQQDRGERRRQATGKHVGFRCEERELWAATMKPSPLDGPLQTSAFQCTQPVERLGRRLPESRARQKP